MFIEEQIQKLQRRIRNIEQNPRPDYLKCTKLRYELELESYQSVLEAQVACKPFAALEGLEQLQEALGFQGLDYMTWGDVVQDPLKYRDIAVSQFGFPEHTCDRTLTRLGLFLSGEVPMPRMMAGRRIPCDPEKWSGMAMAKYAGVPFFELCRLASSDYENLRCVAEQAGELIEYAEKTVPGIKYSEDKLIEMLEVEHQAHVYLQDTYELRKRIPCPISPQDSFRLMALRGQHRNYAKVLEYFRMYHDELFERAEKGISGVPEEKLRIAWLATGPYGRETFDLLAKKGVSIPWYHYGIGPWMFGVVRDNYGDDSVYGRKLTPLEEVVRTRAWNTNVWAGSGDMWVDSLVKACRDLKIDAVVDFLQVGCITTKNLKKITSQRLSEQLGIPTLDLEGREFFATPAGKSEMNRRLEEFLDICIANKK